jgi:hypothetical protein
VQPNFAAIEPIAAHCEAWSAPCSNIIRTARKRTSAEYRFDVFDFSIAPTSQGSEPPANPARFMFWMNRGLEHECAIVDQPGGVDNAAQRIGGEHLSADVLRAVREGTTDLRICNAAVLGSRHAWQTRHYRDDRLVLVVPRLHPLADRGRLDFADALKFDHVGLHSNSSIHLAMQRAAAKGGAVRLRIQVTGLDAMCRMIVNGMGIGVMPRRAFDLMQMRDALVAVELLEDWAARQISLVARDFDSLPAPSRKLAEHLTDPLGHSAE